MIVPRRGLPVRAVATLFLVTGALNVTAAPGRAQAAAKVLQAPGALLSRAKDAPRWGGISAGSTVPAGTSLLALFEAVLQAPNGGVEAKLIADVGQRGPLPVLEAGVTPLDAGSHDFAIRLDRGLVVLTNTKPTGPATVVLTVRDTPIEVTLKAPRDRLAIEIYGRHAPGEINLDGKDEPVLHAFLIALHGEAFLKATGKGVRLHAAPGPAVLVWDSLTREVDVQHFDKVPDYARPPDAQEKKVLAGADGYAARIVGADPAGTLDRQLRSDDPLERKVAVTSAAAVDDLPRVLLALTTSTHADTRDFAILALRNWLGRQPGQTKVLHEALTDTAKLTPTQALTVIQLLNGFPPEARRDPETLALLVEYLQHPQPAIRGLAHWHLVRLVPAAKDIPYDALAPEAERGRAAEQWRARVPAGTPPAVQSAK